MLRVTLGLLFLLLVTGDAAAQGSSRISGIPGVIAAGAEVELVKDGFTFLEGPVGTSDGGLYFTDLEANRMYRLDGSGRIDVFRENTNRANGLAFDALLA